MFGVNKLLNKPWDTETFCGFKQYVKHVISVLGSWLLCALRIKEVFFTLPSLSE